MRRQRRRRLFRKRVLRGAVVAAAVLGIAALANWQLRSPKHVSSVVVAPATTTSTTPAPTTTTVPPLTGTSYVAQARKSKVAVYDNEGDPTATQTLANPTESGAPLVFLLTGPPAGGAKRVEVYLPVRPNGSKGWVTASEVTVTQHEYHMRIELSAHLITVTNGEEMVLQEPIGVGTTDTPTPGGIFYLKELLQPSNPNGPYGPYAYGLSGFSNVLTQFAGGDGVIGVHGTNQPELIGQDVSHGCIRMSNAGITKLAKLLPLGTPVQIVA